MEYWSKQFCDTPTGMRPGVEISNVTFTFPIATPRDNFVVEEQECFKYYVLGIMPLRVRICASLLCVNIKLPGRFSSAKCSWTNTFLSRIKTHCFTHYTIYTDRCVCSHLTSMHSAFPLIYCGIIKTLVCRNMTRIINFF